MTPKHYEGEIEPIVFMQSVLTAEEFKGYLKGNIIKYISRAEKKGGAEDYQKALVYCQWLVEHENTYCV